MLIFAVSVTVQRELINKYKNSLKTKNSYNNSSDHVNKAGKEEPKQQSKALSHLLRLSFARHQEHIVNGKDKCYHRNKQWKARKSACSTRDFTPRSILHE